MNSVNHKIGYKCVSKAHQIISTVLAHKSLTQWLKRKFSFLTLQVSLYIWPVIISPVQSNFHQPRATGKHCWYYIVAIMVMGLTHYMILCPLHSVSRTTEWARARVNTKIVSCFVPGKDMPHSYPFLDYCGSQSFVMHKGQQQQVKSLLYYYCKISNIRCIKSENLNDSRLLLQLSLPNPLKPGVKTRMKM